MFCPVMRTRAFQDGSDSKTASARIYEINRVNHRQALEKTKEKV
jgi:hypothetical protein